MSASAARVAGGGKPSSDCYAVLDVEGDSTATENVQLTCTDGDPSCDHDGVCGNGACDFSVRLCVNADDMSNCAAPAALKQISLRRGSLNLPTSLVGSQCGAYTTETVGVRTVRGKAKPGHSVLRVTAKAPAGITPRRDKDSYVLVCAPRVDDCPAPTTSTVPSSTTSTTSATSTTSVPTTSTSTSATSTTTTSSSTTTSTTTSTTVTTTSTTTSTTVTTTSTTVTSTTDTSTTVTSTTDTSTTVTSTSDTSTTVTSTTDTSTTTTTTTETSTTVTATTDSSTTVTSTTDTSTTVTTTTTSTTSTTINTQPDPCIAEPCLNGGTCSSVVVGNALVAQCSCVNGFSGEICELNDFNCAPGSGGECLNGGNCVPDPTGGYCACQACFTGAQCEMYSSECA